MLSTAHIISLLRDFKAQSALKYQIKFMGIFGSCARGQQDEQSDIDVFISLQDLSLHPALKKNILKDAIYI